MKKHIINFFFPKLNAKFAIRFALVIAVAFLTFKYLFIPLRIRGKSMEPSYHDGSFNFCFVFGGKNAKKGDVVAIKMAGARVMYLKRIVAQPGDTVEFRKGKLYVNDKMVEENYVKYPCEWELPPRKVSDGCVYVIGDNRSMPIDEHSFGETEIRRIAGNPMW